MSDRPNNRDMIDDAMPDIEAVVARELKSIFDAGGFDAAGKAIAERLKGIDIGIATAIHVNFVVKAIPIRHNAGPSGRVKVLGHLAVIADAHEERAAPSLRFALAPSEIDSSTPCATCGGSGVSMRAGEVSLPAKRLFETTFRPLTD